MTKILRFLCLMIIILLSSNVLRAEDPTKVPYTLNVNVGRSWLNGVLGAEFISDNAGVSVGWMPARVPITQDIVHSFNFTLNYYSKFPYEDKCIIYGSVGFTSKGYRYKNIETDEELIMPMTILGTGLQYKTDIGGYFKIGLGYGFCEEGSTPTWEVVWSFPIIKNKF